MDKFVRRSNIPGIIHSFSHSFLRLVSIYIRSALHMMKSTIFTIVTFALLLTFVQCNERSKAVAEYEIKQGRLLSDFSIQSLSRRISFQVFSVEVEVMTLLEKRMPHRNSPFEMNCLISEKNFFFYKMAKNVTL